VFAQIVQFVSTGLPSWQPTPPAVDAVFPLIEQLVNTGFPFPVHHAPPPRLAVFAVIVQQVSLGSPPTQYMPPPKTAEFPPIVQFVIVGIVLFVQHMPPPPWSHLPSAVFPSIVQLSRTGLPPSQSTPPPLEAVLPLIVQLLNIGLLSLQ
jgi:hypothetical protein